MGLEYCRYSPFVDARREPKLGSYRLWHAFASSFWDQRKSKPPRLQTKIELYWFDQEIAYPGYRCETW